MSLANYIKDDYIRFGTKTWHKSKVSEDMLRQAIRNNPALLKPGWSVTAKGQIIVDPATTTRPPVGAPPRPESHADPVATPGVPGSGIGGGTGVTSAVPPPPPPPPPPPRPELSQFANYQDADYFLGLNDLRNQLGLVQQADGSMVSQAAQSRLQQLGQRIDPTSLQPVAVGGKTLYDILYDQQTQADARSKSLSRSEAARRGVVRSGYMDRTLTDLAGQSASARDQLVRNYGTDLNDSRSAAYQASQQQAGLLSQYQQAQANIAAAATQRGYQNALNQYQNTYGGY